MRTAPRTRTLDLATTIGQELARGTVSPEDVLAAIADGFATGSLSPASLARLEALDRIEAAAGSLLGEVVDDARFQRLSWSSIGLALGLTRQGAWDKYHRREDLPQKP